MESFEEEGEKNVQKCLIKKFCDLTRFFYVRKTVYDFLVKGAKINTLIDFKVKIAVMMLVDGVRGRVCSIINASWP